jgi:hypothetical protein
MYKYRLQIKWDLKKNIYIYISFPQRSLFHNNFSAQLAFSALHRIVRLYTKGREATSEAGAGRHVRVCLSRRNCDDDVPLYKAPQFVSEHIDSVMESLRLLR